MRGQALVTTASSKGGKVRVTTTSSKGEVLVTRASSKGGGASYYNQQ